MARLIKAEDAAKWIRTISEQARPGELDWRGHQEWDNLTAAMKDCIGYCPTVEAVEVVHGRWIPSENGGYHCSVCDKRFGFVFDNYYCPNCGAKMRGSEE